VGQRCSGPGALTPTVRTPAFPIVIGRILG